MVQGEVKEQLKTIVAVLLSVLVALGITLGTGLVLANGEHEPEENHEHEASEFEVTLSSSPRFPVVGEEAEFTFRVSHDGTPEERLMVTVVLARAEEEDHHHDAEEHEEAEADDHQHDEGVADDHHDEAENVVVESAGIVAIETAPGVYVVKYTFEQEGKYLGTAQIGEEQADFVVAVRSSPVAWSFVIGLAAVSVLMAGVVTVVKTVRKEW